MKPRKTVLIITDAEDIHSGVGWLLERRGFRAIEVDWYSALKTSRLEAPSLVLIDTDYPLSESLALSRSLKEQFDSAPTQIVIVTSADQFNSQNKGDYILDKSNSFA